MYNDTVWHDGTNMLGLEGFGFTIKKIVVHKAPTDVNYGTEHYNMLRNEWDVRKLLEVCFHLYFYFVTHTHFYLTQIKHAF